MKKILVILDGIVAKKLMQRIIESNTGENSYDVIYMNDAIIPTQNSSNITFYKFDPTSEFKLKMILEKNIHSEVFIALNSKEELLNVIKNIKLIKKNLQIIALDYWGIDIDDPYVSIYRGIDILANGMVERLPNVPVLAQNIGMKEGEIMEVKIPFGSSYAYRYIGSIEQKDWKIFGLYRHQQLVNIKASLILKPNDIILIIGKPKVLMQIYNVIIRSEGQFPMPFGVNAYLYLDLYLQDQYRVIQIVQEAKYLNQQLKNKNLIVRITRPTTATLMNLIKNELKGINSIIIQIDYHNIGMQKLIKNDINTFDIGLLILGYEIFKNKKKSKVLINFKVPVFKLGHELLVKTKFTSIIVNDVKSYEQISPIIFDISSQLKTKTKIFDMHPLEKDENIYKLLDHFENLAKIFNQKIEIISNQKNPIRYLSKQKNILQIMPLKKDMFKKRFFFKFFYTNSDLISFDMSKDNQLLIPIVE